MFIAKAGVAWGWLMRAPLGVRILSMYCLGASGTMAMPPWTWWPVLWILLPLFIAILSTANGWKQSLVLGWAFGFGHFSSGFAWMGNAFFVDREAYAMLAVPAIGALAAGFGLYVGVAALALQALASPPVDAMPRTRAIHVLVRVIFFAAIWSLVEWWRGWFLTGLPWNPIGSVWVSALPVLQGASVIGVFGLSLVTILAATSCILLTHRLDLRFAIIAVFVCHLPLVLIAVWGGLRLPSTVTPIVPEVVLRLVQPNIAQQDKWRPALRESHLSDQVSLSTVNAAAVTHVLWAETAAPFALNRAPQAVALASGAAPQGGYLLTGAPRIEGDGKDRRAFNSLFVITPQATIEATYDKAHLVPFGEYMPLRDVIPLPQLAVGSGFNAGPGIQTIHLPGLPAFNPLICYEVIFPGAVTTPAERPQWLFNLTNDAWFGLSSGPHQHLAAAQLRAAEEGLPVVRVANTGISAVVDPFGRIIASIPLGQRGYVDSGIPQSLNPTPFARIGHGLFLFIAVFLAGAAAAVVRRTQD